MLTDGSLIALADLPDAKMTGSSRLVDRRFGRKNPRCPQVKPLRVSAPYHKANGMQWLIAPDLRGAALDGFGVTRHGPPDADAISKLRARFDTKQLSALKAT